jgi:diaminopimelate epimerase
MAFFPRRSTIMIQVVQKIPFTKMSGSGNDFIIIDNRDADYFRSQSADDLRAFIAKVCARKMAVGADGFILIERSATVDFCWQFYNSDGSRAEMCGNGARCAARFAHLNGIAGETMSFETDAGLVEAKVHGGEVKIKMSDPIDLRLDVAVELKEGALKLDSINTGVPHAILWVDDNQTADIVTVGRTIRRHKVFEPAGTNVNFVSRINDNEISVRTYERGVEDETLACGTGCVAAAIVSAARFGAKSPVKAHVRSGGCLTIYFSVGDGPFLDVYLEGDARVIYQANLDPGAWQW